MTASSSRSISLALALAVLTVTIGAQSSRPLENAEKFKWNLAEIYPNRRGVANGEGHARGGSSEAEAVPGQAHLVGGHAGRRAGTAGRLLEDARAALQLREPAGRSGHARLGSRSGMRQEMNQLGAAFGAESSFIEPGAAEGRRGHGQEVRRGRAAAQDLRASTSPTSSAARRTR